MIFRKAPSVEKLELLRVRAHGELDGEQIRYISVSLEFGRHVEHFLRIQRTFINIRAIYSMDRMRI